jgi:hypothetical protein
MPALRGPRRTHGLFIHVECPAAQRRQTGAFDGLPDDVITADQLLQAGNTGAATALLHRHLHGRDYDWFPAEPALIDACTLYATVTTGTVQVAAAAYAHRAARQLHEPHHPRRLAAAHAYGTALHHNDQPAHAAAVRHELLGAYLTAGLAEEAVRAATDLATSQHAAGHCTDAITTIDATWHAWHRDPTLRSDHTTGAALLRAYLLILRGCRRDHDLLTLLRRAEQTEAIETLAATRTTASAQDDSDYVTAHRRDACTHQPQHLNTHHAATRTDSPTGTPIRTRESSDPAPEADNNPIWPDRVPQHIDDPGTHRRPLPQPSFTGYHQRDIESATAHLLSTSEAALLLDPGQTDRTTRDAARQAAVESTAAHLAHRRALRIVGLTLTALITAAGLLTLNLLS